MDNSSTKVNVVHLEELGRDIFSVCITFAPGQTRKEKARFWAEFRKEKEKYCLYARINGKVLVLAEREISKGPYTINDLQVKAETYADVVRKNLINYL